jgi:hypothetical protein
MKRRASPVNLRTVLSAARVAAMPMCAGYPARLAYSTASDRSTDRIYEKHLSKLEPPESGSFLVGLLALGLALFCPSVDLIPNLLVTDMDAVVSTWVEHYRHTTSAIPPHFFPDISFFGIDLFYGHHHLAVL